MKVWRLKPGSDRRFRAGHPWVYSNELAESPKGIEPGASVELRDATGKFLARGYGNPNSLIAFRELSRVPSDETPHTPQGVLERLKRAARLREQMGLASVSYRLSFGEADQLPGLIIDRYLLEGGEQVFVVQAHTAGMDRLMPELEAMLQAHVKTAKGPDWSRTAIVLNNDVGFRKMEGLEPVEAKALRSLEGVDLNQVKIRVVSASGGEPVLFATDLLGGQKTGFFLDQTANTQLAAQRLAPATFAPGSKKIRILDLCSYVGQWSTQLSRLYRQAGLEVEVVAVDGSEQALRFARQNVEAQGAKFQAVRGDVLKDLAPMEAQSFDIVVSDPPALIKGRKDLGAGTHAYLQLNTQALRLTKKGGALIACSCSSLLAEEEFLRTLAKAASRNSVRVQWIGRGAQAPDHPILAEFPEGQYLKAWIGIVT